MEAADIQKEAYNVVVSTASSGDVTLQSIDPGRTFKVLGAHIRAGAATSLTFKSGSTSISGAIPLTTTSHLDLPTSVVPWFLGVASGDDLVLNNSGTNQIDGFLVVAEEQ